nr:caffeic acid 3-o-methyltransferase [Quercus suber]
MASPIQSHQGILNGNLKQEEEESFPYAMQLVNSCALPMALQSTIELGVFDILAKAGPGAKLSPSQIVAQMPTKNPEATVMLDRILRMLASHSVLGCSVVADEFGSYQRLYSLSPVSKHFVRNEDGVSLGPLMALLQDKVFLDSWPQLKDAILEGGIPFNRVYGMHAFEYPSMEPRFNQVLNTAMLNHTTIVIKQTLESYKGFEQLRQLIDVGGGLGVTLNLITSRYPHIKGINFDLPHVIQHAPPYPGVEHLGGNMFESIPKGDNIFMKWILHDWNDEHCVKLLKNCYNAIPHDGKKGRKGLDKNLLPWQPKLDLAASNMNVLSVIFGLWSSLIGDIHCATHGLKAIELGVFDILAKVRPGAKLSPSQIVAQMPTKNPDVAIPHSQAVGQQLCAWLCCGCKRWELWVFPEALQSCACV